jgi:signal transduction histidine kinase
LSGFIGAASDITEAKQAEIELQGQVAERTAELVEAQDQLRQSQKMEALGQLTGGIAHDFNNLLTVVVGGLDLITKQISDERPDEICRQCAGSGGTRRQAYGAAAGIQQGPAAGGQADLCCAADRGNASVASQCAGAGIEKVFDLDPHLTPVLADPTQVEVAVLNLAINARDAMPEGGTLTFSTRKVPYQ